MALVVMVGRVACLVTGIAFIAYVFATSGDQPWFAFLGGMLAALSISLEGLGRHHA